MKQLLYCVLCFATVCCVDAGYEIQQYDIEITNELQISAREL